MKRASLLIPRFLQNCGIENAVAPIRDRSGQLHARMNGNEGTADIGKFSLTLYPYIEGESDWGMSLSAAQWRDWGSIMRSIHDGRLSRRNSPTTVPHEVFAVKWLEKIERVEARLDARRLSRVAAMVAQIWRDNADVIDYAAGAISLWARGCKTSRPHSSSATPIFTRRISSLTMPARFTLSIGMRRCWRQRNAT